MPKTQSEQAAFALTSLPGVRRDGTDLDNQHYQSAQWVRFQRGRPRKMGGYRLMSELLSGPIRAAHVDGRDPVNALHTFSRSAIEKLDFNNNGVGGGVTQRTPAGFAVDDDYTWQVDTMFQSGGGGAPNIIACCTPDALNIASDATGKLYAGDITGTSALAVVQDVGVDIEVSGGCCVLQPFLFVYGSNGLIKNSDANNFSSATGWTIGGSSLANEANVAGSKIVKGLPTRGGGRAPAGLFWALDALIRVSFVGGTTLWQYDTVSAATSVLAKNAIVEYDGVYFWPGVDRFYMYTGVVQELPNDMNLNFFYDRINPAHRNKTWALKVPRFGEIWWFFPLDDSTEPNHAVIFNVRERTWYDTSIERSAGAAAQIFTRPILTGGDQRESLWIPFSGLTGAFAIGETVEGATSSATGTVLRVMAAGLNVDVVAGDFQDAETIDGPSGSATIADPPYAETLDSAWLHEIGTDRVYKQEVTAIPASFETTQFQWMSGGPTDGAPGGPNVQTRLVRLEPDFVLTGALEMRVNGAAYAQAQKELSEAYTITPTTEFVDLREQRRELSIVFTSNVAGGDFQMGKNFITVEPGDARG